MITRLLHFLLNLFFRPPPPSIPEHHNARSSARPSFEGIRLTPGETVNPLVEDFLRNTKEQTLIWGWGAPEDHSMDAAKYLMGPPPPKPTSHYRDEDGELRPSRFDRSPLSDSSLEDVAAEYLRAEADAENMPDPFDRVVIAALRDAFGQELYNRTLKGASAVRVGGQLYLIVASAGGTVDLVSIDDGL